MKYPNHPNLFPLIPVVLTGAVLKVSAERLVKYKEEQDGDKGGSYPVLALPP